MNKKLSRPDGVERKITYRTSETISAGEYLVTDAETCYLIREARLMRSEVRKYALTVCRCLPSDIPLFATKWRLVWDKRKKVAKPRR